MTDKEMEAIKYLYNIRATIDESYMLFDEGITVKCEKEIMKKITTVINLIEKQQNRIAELEQIEEAHRELNGELRKELQMKKKVIARICL